MDVGDGMLSVVRNELLPIGDEPGKLMGECWILLLQYHYLGERNLNQSGARSLDAITCVFALFLLNSPHTAIKTWIGFLRHGGTLVVETNDRTKAQSFTLQYLETMNHGGSQFLIFCGSKERHRGELCYK